MSCKVSIFQEKHAVKRDKLMLDKPLFIVHLYKSKGLLKKLYYSTKTIDYMYLMDGIHI